MEGGGWHLLMPRQISVDRWRLVWRFGRNCGPLHQPHGGSFPWPSLLPVHPRFRVDVRPWQGAWEHFKYNLIYKAFAAGSILKISQLPPPIRFRNRKRGADDHWWPRSPVFIAISMCDWKVFDQLHSLKILVNFPLNATLNTHSPPLELSGGSWTTCI